MVIKVLNYQFTPELQNKSSKIFIETAENFTAEVSTVFQLAAGKHNLKIIIMLMHETLAIYIFKKLLQNKAVFKYNFQLP